jgi:hypothetical protein
MNNEKQSFNYDARLGGDTDDMDLCRRYGIDPSLAYTVGINEAVRKAIQKENIYDLQRAGYSEGQAMSIADKQYNDAAAGGRIADAQLKKAK